MNLLLKLLISVGLLAAIIWMLGGVEELVRIMAGFDLRYVVVVLILSTLDRALMTFKWAWLLKSRGVYLPLFKGMKIYCAAMIWSTFLPSTISADVIRAVCTSRAGLDSKEVVASIIVERLIGFLSALLLGVLGVVLLIELTNASGDLESVLWLAVAMLIGATALFAVSFSYKSYDYLHNKALSRLQHTRLFRKLRELHSTYLTYERGRANLAKFFGMTLSEQMLAVVYIWLIAEGLGTDVGLLFVAGALPLALLVSRLPVSLDGLGVFEGVFIVLMSLAGIPPQESVAIAFTGRIFQMVSWLPWWLAYVMETGRIKRPAVEASGG